MRDGVGQRTVSRIEDVGRRSLRRLEAGHLPRSLTDRWIVPPADAEPSWTERLWRFRRTVVPWLADVAPLDGSKILEIGSGRGSSTWALAEQGAQVTGIDLLADDLERASALLTASGLSATFRTANARDLAQQGPVGSFDQIIFWAVLEHMTVDERLDSLASGWERLGPGGLLTVVETPNRLWPYDAHTSQLPYFSWLPYDLAYRYSAHSERPGFGDRYAPEHVDRDFEHFLRRGHGVSFHEFDLAIGSHADLEVASYMQGYWRDRNPVRRAGWAASTAGRVERTLAGFSPDTHRAWFQPYLYLSLRKT